MSKLYIYGILLLIICSCSKERLGDIQYIAHAGGEIDGYTYTNSLEAVNNSIKNGCLYFEADLQFTSDSVLVCVHSWYQFRKMCGESVPGNSPLSFEEFMAGKIYGKYTPMSAFDIVSILKNNPNVYLVVDKSDDICVLEKYFSQYRSQIIIETGDINNYFDLKDAGYFRPMFSNYSNLIVRWISHPSVWFRGRISWICASYRYVQTNNLDIRINRFLDINYATFTINDTSEINDLGRNVKMVYTDHLFMKEPEE